MKILAKEFENVSIKSEIIRFLLTVLFIPFVVSIDIELFQINEYLIPTLQADVKSKCGKCKVIIIR